MAQDARYQCPICGFGILKHLEDGMTYTCGGCARSFRVMLDERTRRAAFYQESGGEPAEPLNLPRGSIRAMTAVAMAGACWSVLLAGQDVPGSLFGLVLTILGYYFGFRTKAKAAEGRVFDPSARKQTPLAPSPRPRGRAGAAARASAVSIADLTARATSAGNRRVLSAANPEPIGLARSVKGEATPRVA